MNPHGYIPLKGDCKVPDGHIPVFDADCITRIGFADLSRATRIGNDYYRFQGKNGDVKFCRLVSILTYQYLVEVKVYDFGSGLYLFV